VGLTYVINSLQFSAVSGVENNCAYNIIDIKIKDEVSRLVSISKDHRPLTTKRGRAKGRPEQGDKRK
jgi:hypothetical protein